MNWNPRVIAAIMWSGVVGLADVGYIFSHGVDVFAVGFAALAVAPAWTFFERDVDLTFFGGRMKISGKAVEKTTDTLLATAPRAVERVDDELSRIRDQAQERKPLPNTSNITSPELLALTGTGRIITDANLVLVNLRIEIEKRLTVLASALNLFEHRIMPLSAKINELVNAGVLEQNFAGALREMVRFGNKAVHGATVDQDVAGKILSSQDRILGTLDQIIQLIEAPGATDSAETTRDHFRANFGVALGDHMFEKDRQEVRSRDIAYYDFAESPEIARTAYNIQRRRYGVN